MSKIATDFKNAYFDLASHMRDEISSRDSFRTKSLGLYPSEASFKTTKFGFPAIEGTCLRKTFLRTLGVEAEGNEISGDKQLMFSVGKEVERGIIDEYKQSGLYLDSNVKFYWDKGNFTISGEVDCFIKNPKTGKAEIVEVKSFYGYAPEKEIFGSKRPPICGSPKLAQLSQLMIYLDFYSKQGIECGHMHYLERGNGKSKAFYVRLDEQGHALLMSNDYAEPKRTEHSVHDIYERYTLVQRCINDRVIPAKDFHKQYSDARIAAMYTAGALSKTDKAIYERGANVKKGDWQCNGYCPYEGLCWGGANIPFLIKQQTGISTTHIEDAADFSLSID